LVHAKIAALQHQSNITPIRGGTLGEGSARSRLDGSPVVATIMQSAAVCQSGEQARDFAADVNCGRKKTPGLARRGFL
jgi:hypothetical protein